MFKRLAIFVGALLLGNNVIGQLTTNTTMTPTQLVQNVLVGQGVTVSNVVFTGDPNAIGEFDGSASNVGINSGIILSSGTVLDQTTGTSTKNGPVGPNNNGGATTVWGTAGDTDLDALVSSTTFDAAVLEFDFIPQGDTIEFNYVFASEEYIEYVGSSFNDVFAFFISGPGIAGTQNIALIPGTTTPVSIGTVNHTSNSTYFIQNGDGSTGPQTTDNTVINFDGFTTPLTAVTKVTPCQTYHLKIAIADVVDQSFDSGVFLQGGSLSSSPAYTYEQSTTFDPFGDSQRIPEGCSDGVIEMTREEGLNTELIIPFRILGTATNGVDYTLLNNSVTFPIGSNTTSITIETLGDALAESDETVILRFPTPSVCNADSFDIEYTIVERALMTASTINEAITCPGEKAQLTADFNGGIPDFKYTWNTGAKTQTIEVNPASTTTYYFTVSDTCGNSASDSAIVSVPVNLPLALNLSNDTTVRCPGVQVPLVGQGVNGGGTYTYTWDSGEITNSKDVTVSGSSTHTLTVTDNCGNSESETVDITLNYPALSVQTTNDTVICKGDTATFGAQAAGGIPPYTYVWETGHISQTSEYSGGVSKTLTVTATDSCSIVPATDTIRITIQQPTADFSISAPIPEAFEPIYFQDLSSGSGLTYDWDFGNGTNSIDQHAETTYSSDTTYDVILWVTDDLGCRDSATGKVTILPPLYYYIPNAFTPNGDGKNDEFVGKGIGIDEFDLRIFDRWGIEIYATDDPRKGWNGLYKNTGKRIPDGVYVYRVIVRGKSGKEYDKLGTVTLLR